MLPTLASPVCLAGNLTPIGSFFPAYYSSNYTHVKYVFEPEQETIYDLLARVKPS